MKLITVGCSFTEGQELDTPSFDCYTAKLAKQLNLEYYNFGLCGASNDYIFRKVFELIESNILTNEDILIIQWTHYNRKELPLIHNNKNWYYYPPNTLIPMNDKKLIYETHGVHNEYINTNLDSDMYMLKYKHENLLKNYTYHFLHNQYQKNTTKNYINSLYTYLEHFGYKHLHFFGWDTCIIESVFDNNANFIKESFGGYTNTTNNHHPNKKGHEDWANFLNKKLMKNHLIVKQLELYKIEKELTEKLNRTKKKII
jgi:hypothetical protein